MFIFAPDSEQGSLPDEARIRQMIADSKKMEIAAPKFKAVESRLLSSTPERGLIVSESTDAETGAVLWELSNRARVILKSTKNKKDEIIMDATARGGISSVTPEDNVSASIAVEMAQVFGLGPWTCPELTRKLAGKQVYLSPTVYYYERDFSGSSNSGDLKTFFEMLYLSFTDPCIDSEAVQAMMNQYKTYLANRDEDPKTVFYDEITRAKTSGHP